MLRTGSSSHVEQLAVPTGAEFARAHEEFRRRHSILLPGLLGRAAAEEIAERVESAEFYRLEHEGIGVEACMEANATLAWLLLLVNDTRVREFVEAISGRRPIGHYDGRVYRLEPAAEHYDSWHSDLVDNRLVAMSINLSPRPYEGGALEIRDRRTGETAEIRSPELGDALLFDLDEHLEHRVLPVTGDAPRTVLAGWFKGGSELPLGTVFGRTDADAGGDGEGDRLASETQRRRRQTMAGEQLRTNKDVVSRRVGGEVVLVHLERDKMYSLNPTGARAWELLADGQDLESVETTLADEFGVDRTEVRSELESLIAMLEQEELVEKA